MSIFVCSSMYLRKLFIHIAYLCLLVYLTPIVGQNLHILIAHSGCDHCSMFVDKNDGNQISKDSHRHCPICEYEMVVKESPQPVSLFSVNLPSVKFRYKYYLLSPNVSCEVDISTRAPPMV